MANYFQLFKKDDPDAGPQKFSEIDDLICAHFNTKPHDTRYYCSWYDIIGFALAMGKNWEEIRAMLRKWVAEDDTPEARAKWEPERQQIRERIAAGEDTTGLPADWEKVVEPGGFNRRLLEIVDWLEERYTPTAWARIGNGK